MVEKYLSETDIKKLLQCSRCKKVPATPPIYMCRTGHHECSSCYSKDHLADETDRSTDTESESGSVHKEEYRIGVLYPNNNHKRNYKHTCAICKEEITKTRNLFAECLLIHLDGKKDDRQLYLPEIKNSLPQQNYAECCYNIYGSQCSRFVSQTLPVPCEQQTYQRYQPVQQYTYTSDPYLVDEPQTDFQGEQNVFYPDYGNSGFYNDCQNRKEASDRRSRCNFASQGSVISLNGESSRRPIRCPTHFCGRNIAVTALSSHFCFDHPDVPPVNLDLDVNSHLFVDPDTIPFNYAKCMALLLIQINSDTVNTVSHPSVMNTSRMRNSLPLIVMASWLECQSKLNQGKIHGIAEEDNQSDTLNHGDFQDHGNTKTPLLIIWIAGLETNSALYATIQVTEKETNIRSMIYTGPITSLRNNQTTSKIFELGDCLVIHPGMLESIIGERGGFDLHVMIH